MNKEQIRSINPGEVIGFQDSVNQLTRESWPEFMWHNSVIKEHWDDLFDRFPEYQAILLDTKTNQPIAVGHSLPFVWEAELNRLPDNGWDWVVKKAVQDHKEGRTPTAQVAIIVAIHTEYQRQGLSSKVLHAVRSIGESKGFTNLVVPVRPNLKRLYPLINMDDYIQWTNDEGMPFDAWLRVHVRLGGKIIKVCPQAKTVLGTRAEWEEWTGLKFPQSGEYIVPGALSPMELDIEKDEGIYIEPNVWMQHSLA